MLLLEARIAICFVLFSLKKIVVSNIDADIIPRHAL